MSTTTAVDDAAAAIEADDRALPTPPIDRVEVELATASPSRLATYVVEADRLVVVSDRGRDEVRFDDIGAINLQATLGAYVMRLQRKSGGVVMVRSRCVLPSGVEDRNDDYARLVRALHAACSGDVSIDFVGGSTARYWLGWFLVVDAVGLCGLALFALSDGAALRWPLTLMTLAVSLGLAGGLAGIRQGRRVAYDPAAPGRLLPRDHQ